jgi:hypothetical protein
MTYSQILFDKKYFLEVEKWLTRELIDSGHLQGTIIVSVDEKIVYHMCSKFNMEYRMISGETANLSVSMRMHPHITNLRRYLDTLNRNRKIDLI